MQPFPHVYSVAADGATAGAVTLTAAGVPALLSTAPREFDGPGDQWSPEALLAGAVAGCFILSFRASARAARLEWSRLECAVDGTLERIEGVTRFTKIVIRTRLTAPATAAADLCRRVLEKAEQGCLIANSLNAQRALQIDIVQEGSR